MVLHQGQLDMIELLAVVLEEVFMLLLEEHFLVAVLFQLMVERDKLAILMVAVVLEEE